MIKTWFRFGGMAAMAAAAFGLASAATAANVTVYSNNMAPGDNFVGSGTSGLILPVDATGWFYANVRDGTTIGINNTYAHPAGGNGSVYFNAVNPSGNSTGKADIVYGTGGVLGLLSKVTALSYDWYRASTSTVEGHLTPSIRLGVISGTRSGYLVYEPAYNAYPTNGPGVPTNQWIPTNAYASGTGRFWATDSLYDNGSNTFETFNTWLTMLDPNAVVVELNSGVGSGWMGTFTGAVDNIALGFDGVTTTYDFEVKAVPEPGSVVMGLIAGGLGLAGAAWRRRRAG